MKWTYHAPLLLRVSDLSTNCHGIIELSFNKNSCMNFKGFWWLIMSDLKDWQFKVYQGYFSDLGGRNIETSLKKLKFIHYNSFFTKETVFRELLRPWVTKNYGTFAEFLPFRKIIRFRRCYIPSYTSMWPQRPLSSDLTNSKEYNNSNIFRCRPNYWWNFSGFSRKSSLYFQYLGYFLGSFAL